MLPHSILCSVLYEKGNKVKKKKQDIAAVHLYLEIKVLRIFELNIKIHYSTRSLGNISSSFVIIIKFDNIEYKLNLNADVDNNC